MFSIFQETVSSREVDKYMFEGAPLFDRYFEWCRENIDYLVLNRKQISNLEAEKTMLETVESLFSGNFCENYLKKAHGYDCSNILMTIGLEKTTVHLMERIRLLLEEFKVSALTFEASREMANRKEYKELGELLWFYFGLIFLEYLTYAMMLSYRHLVVNINRYIEVLIR